MENLPSLTELLDKLAGSMDDNGCQCDDCRKRRGQEPLPRKTLRELTDEEKMAVAQVIDLRKKSRDLQIESEMFAKEAGARLDIVWARIHREFPHIDSDRISIDKEAMAIKTTVDADFAEKEPA